jgi:hypothetical protein
MSEALRNRILFYVALPVVIGFLLGANQTGIGQWMPWWASVVFWVTCTLASWMVFHAGTVVAAAILRPWEPPLSAKLALGLAIASIPARLLINAYLGAFEGLLDGGRAVQALPEAQLSWDFTIRYIQGWSGPYVVWISANVFFDRVVGFSRYRPPAQHANPTAEITHDLSVRATNRDPDHPVAGDLDASNSETAGPGAAPFPTASEQPLVSPLLSRLPRSLGLNILAVKSEDHYLRVFTERGDALILYKLSTAMEELERHGYAGLQVHRSYWVRSQAIVALVADDRKLVARLSTGQVVPVSQTYRESVRRAVGGK